MTGLLPKVADRVQETTSTTGTGALTLAGAAGPQQSFINGIGLGVLTSYAILSGDNVGWEINTGTLSGSGPYVLSRGTPSASSNAGSLVALSGVSTVFCDISAAFVGLLQTTFQNNGTVQNVNTLNISNGLTAAIAGTAMTLTAAGGGIYQSGTVASNFSTLEISGSLSGAVTSGILTLTGTGVTSSLGVQAYGTAETLTTLNFSSGVIPVLNSGTLNISVNSSSGIRPALSYFTWLNQGTATATDNSYGPLTISGPTTTTDNNRALIVSTPRANTSPWTVTAQLRGLRALTDYVPFGLFLYDSVSSKLITFCSQITNGGSGSNPQTNVAVNEWTNVTTFSGSAKSLEFMLFEPFWMRIYCDGTNFNFELSCDGYDFNTVYSQSITAYGSPDHIGFGMDFIDTESQGISGQVKLMNWTLV